MKKIAPLILSILFIACSGGQIPTAAKSERLLYDTSKIAILPFDSAELRYVGGEKNIALTNEDLQIVEELFNKCITTYNATMKPEWKKWAYIDLPKHKYKRQYIPFLDSIGHRKVYVNCFCDESNSWFKDWKQNFIRVDDGGVCFFQMVIDLSSNSYENFSVNGYA